MIYVDEITEYPVAAIKPAARHAGRLWAHMWSDTSDIELHDFAHRLGLQRAWHQGPPEHRHSHYDLVPSKRAKAVKLGAKEMSFDAYVMAGAID